jgi:hypothetical protein
MLRRKQIPAVWRPLLWDLDPRSVRLDRDREFLIGRVLVEGGWSATRELRRRFGDDSIRDWLVSHEARGLAPERIRFWELVLQLAPRKANAWVRAARRGVWGRRSAA